MPQNDTYSIHRFFTTPNTHPYDLVAWEKRDAVIMKADGTPAFEQKNVEFPASWSQNATNITASKYFRTVNGKRETSVKEMIERVVNTIAGWGLEDGYFKAEESKIFADELRYIVVNQMATWNSPVWFNIGCPDREQAASACFILHVDDSMPGILEWYRQEGMIFSRGSGSGVNISTLRAKGEAIKKGGSSSGPLSFMRAADASAFSIKSGGTTRRSARMVVMNIDHPDIMDFIVAKMREEQKAKVLQAAGYDDSLDGEIYATVAHQNCNMSVSVTDNFMHAVENDEIWKTHYVTNGAEATHYTARELFHKIAEATHACGDPGMQYNDTMNAWHTCPNGGKINASNPCSEYVFLDNTACNLASINLLKFLRDDGSFDVDAFRHVVSVMITAMEILVSRSSYPTPEIEKNSHDYRTLGLGYANLGALLMAKGLPYDSGEGRDYASSVTALMTGQAYLRSAELATIKGAFAGFQENRDAMLAVMGVHELALHYINVSNETRTIYDAAWCAWTDAIAQGKEYGYRNAQVTVLAPTGTISFMMDCDTTGIEPAIALVSHKKLVGGGTVKHVNGAIRKSLEVMGYGDASIGLIMDDLSHGHSIEECAELEESDLAVFDCAFPATPGGRAISPEGHIRMVAAVQPFLSGSVSKTINLPNSATVEDIEGAYLLGWKLGCKSLAVYRDGCKATQVLSTQGDENTAANGAARVDLPKLNTLEYFVDVYKRSVQLAEEKGYRSTAEKTYFMHDMSLSAQSGPQRKRLPDERQAITHKFSIGGHEGYLTVGLYDNGQPGEMFLRMAKEGSTISGLMDAFATCVSLAWQYGVPLEAMTKKFQGSRFEPAGFTQNSDIPLAKSIIDYIFRWIEHKFLAQSEETQPNICNEAVSTESTVVRKTDTAPVMTPVTVVRSDAPLCSECGSLTQRNGSCWICPGCGMSTGCS